MYVFLRVVLLPVFIVLLWPTSAPACSCESQPNDLREALTSERERADAIFRGRVVGIAPVYEEFDSRRSLVHHVTFEVTETFKGAVAARQVVKTYRPDGVGCGYLFSTGNEYLVYGEADGPGVFETSMCSRTQPTNKASAELDSLRSGRLPTNPVALRRERVSCTECDMHTEASMMVCGGEERCSSAMSPGEAAKALQEGRAFWAYQRRKARAEQKTYGLAADGRAFELVQQPLYTAEKFCMQRVYRRWCERLSVSPVEPGGRPDVTCLGAAPDELLCDETTTRSASWGPVESMAQANCAWNRADAAYCQLDHPPAPLAPGQATKPGVMCARSLVGYRCRLVPDVALERPEGDEP